ncbi:twin-arginine translocase TatA/TatE family subunit [Paenibacillus sp. RC67]|uniref:twin-arginine translocase TatA/TatE family subunit n=1 Tax=Paenibacillus sp. RC67 TaxID=3039392 RepID=UPI0024AD38DE|nr:twin-arginine translocase TatA/TatE family subunit [Paenibacillus sp. RC67]
MNIDSIWVSEKGMVFHQNQSVGQILGCIASLKNGRNTVTKGGPMSISHILLIALVALVLFGPNKLPELGRALGKTMREFKKTANDLMGGLQDEEPQPQPQRKDVTPAPAAASSTQSSSQPPTVSASAQQERPATDSRRLPD